MFSKFKKIPPQLGKQYVLKATVFSLAAIALFLGLKTYFADYITISNSLDGRELPIYCVETNNKQVALSFDAAWGNEDTPKILEILKKYNLHVTFFMTGGWVDAYPEDVKAIAAAGHDLGNHSENHKNMSQISAEECEQELMSVHERVKTLTGKDMTLFRPPFGDYANHVIQTASKCKYLTIQWDVDSLDWKDYGVDSIIKTVTTHKHLGNGSILLMHNGSKYTSDALESVIKGLQEQGYEIVPVSQLVYKNNYHMNHEGRQIPNQTQNPAAIR